MKALHSVTRAITFYVLADDEREAVALAKELCPIDVYPASTTADTSAYRTPNQDADLKKLAVNYTI